MIRGTAIVKLSIVTFLGGAAYVSPYLEFDTLPTQQLESTKNLNGVLLKPGATQIGLSDSDIVENQARPIFSPSRRPFEQKALVAQPQVQEIVAAADEAPSVSKRLRLLGVNISSANTSALVQNTDTGETRWLELGDNFDGWMLRSIEKGSAQFQCAKGAGDDCRYGIELYAKQQPQ